MIAARDVVLAVRRSWAIVLASAALAAATCFAVVSSVDNVYRADAVVTVQAPAHTDPIEVRGQMIALITAHQTLQEAANRYSFEVGLEEPIEADDVGRRTSFLIAGRSPAIVLRGEGGSPDEAEEMARAYWLAALGRAEDVPRPNDAGTLLLPTSDPAASPEPIRPKKVRSVIAAASLGLLIGIGAAMFISRSRRF